MYCYRSYLLTVYFWREFSLDRGSLCIVGGYLLTVYFWREFSLDRGSPVYCWRLLTDSIFLERV